MINRMLIQRPALKKPTKSDSQRHKVYNLERRLMGQCVNAVVPVADLQTVANHACRKWALPKVSVRKLSIKSESDERIMGKWYDDNVIELNPDFHGMNLMTLLHELAHHICDKYESGCEDHGPEFAYHYGQLLDKYNCLPFFAWEVLCDDWGIEIK